MKSLQIGLLLSCLVSAGYSQESYLLVSSGGGVVGTATVYKITRDGKVMKGQGLGEIAYTEQSKLKKCATRKYFKGAKAVLEASPDFIHPGNMYSSLALFDPAPEEARKLYSKINTAMSRLTFSPGSNR
jgi:hypothetical protein